MEKIIVAKDLTKIYGEEGTSVTALNNVNLDFYENKFTAIMGQSGSGKSTLLHCLAGLDKVTSGSIFIKGTDLGNLNDKELTKMRRDSFGFVFQAFNLIPTLTAEENITLPSSIAGKKPDEDWINQIVNAVDIGDRLNHRPNELSGGQQQRVAAARAMATKPEVIFADEPSGNLDQKNAKEFFKLLFNLKSKNRIIIYATHNRYFANLADCRLQLINGKLKTINARK